MKKLCMLDGNLILREHKTGVHIYHTELCRNLINSIENYEIKVGYIENNEVKKIKNDAKYIWIKEFLLKSRIPSRIFMYLFPIEFMYGRNDVYLCDGIFPHLFFKKSKRICLVHDLMVNIYPQNYTFLKKIYLKLFFRNLKRADLILCVSENTKNDIIRFYGIPENKIKVIYGGVECENMNNELGNDIRLDNTLININVDFLFYIGDMRKNKNLINMVRAFIEYKKEYQDETYFYIAGSKKGEEYNIIKKIIDESEYKEYFKFLGYISEHDKFILMKRMKALMFASEYEGMGIPILEAYICNKPVITSNCSSMTELGEECAILVEPHNIGNICKCIKKVLKENYICNPYEERKKLEVYNFKNTARLVNKYINEI